MRIFRGLSRGVNLTLSLVFFIVFLGIGVLAVFFFGGEQRRELAHLKRLPQHEAAAFASAPAGSEMIVTGVLTGNAARHPIGLVAWAQERWIVSTDSDGVRQGDWNTVEAVWPSLLLVVTDGTIKTAAVASARYGRTLHAEIIYYADSPNKLDGMTDGSLRAAGYKNGDTLTVIGYKDEAGQLSPRWFYGGTRDELIKEMQWATWLLTALGILFMAVSPLILFAGLKRFWSE